MRFSSAEDGIIVKLNHYHYGGFKIVNNLVEQFDKYVTREKELPRARIIDHGKHVGDAMKQLEQAKKSTRVGPSLDDMEKSHQKRSKYVLANLERFATAQQR